MNASSFDLKCSKSRWVQHALFGLVLKIAKLNFAKLSSLMYFGTRKNASVLGSKGQTSRSQLDQGPRGGSIELDAVRRVLISSLTIH